MGKAAGSVLVFHFKECWLIRWTLNLVFDEHWLKKKQSNRWLQQWIFSDYSCLHKWFCFASAVSSSKPRLENNATPLKTKWGLFLLKMTVESIFLMMSFKAAKLFSNPYLRAKSLSREQTYVISKRKGLHCTLSKAACAQTAPQRLHSDEQMWQNCIQ